MIWYFFSPTGRVLVCVHSEYGRSVCACAASSTVMSWSQLLLERYNTNVITITKIKKKRKEKALKVKLQEIINKPHFFCCALISCILLNYAALLVTLPQNISIILQVWTRLCILPFHTWGYYLAYFAIQETESQNFIPNAKYINKHLGLETAKHPSKCCPGTVLVLIRPWNSFLVSIRVTSILTLTRSLGMGVPVPLLWLSLFSSTSTCSSLGLFF